MDLPSLINRTSTFSILGALGGIYRFCSNSDRTFCKQTVENLIRRHNLWRLVWVCTVCLHPTKRMLGLYNMGLIIFANSLDPDQDRNSIIPDLGLNCLTLKKLV